MSDARPGWDVDADIGGEVDLDELGASVVGVGPRVLARVVAVLAEAEAEVEPVDVVAEVAQDVPQGQRVLAPGHGNEDAVARLDHPVVLDRSPNLLAAVMEEASTTEAGVVAADVDHRRGAAPAALHAAPPETTGRISTSSSSCSCSSPVTSVSPRMTSTDSRLISSRSRRAWTRMGPSMSSSLRGLRRTTFTYPV